jgi:autotransporter-associated beta strand protein
MRRVLLTVAVGAALALAQHDPAPAASSSAPIDITSQVLGSANVTLTGDSVINLPPGTTSYNGVLSGQGTLTVRAPSGPGTLVLAKDSDFTLPDSRRHQSVTTTAGPHPVTTVSDPDPPAIIVAAGATLWYGNGGSTGVIGHYPYGTPGYALNQDNIEVEGTLYLQIINRNYNLGTISGSGLVYQPRNNWGTLDLAGTHPFSGVIYNGTGMAFGKPYYPLALPNAKAIVNTGSALITAMRDYTLVLRQDFYENHWGDDINFHSAGNGLVVMTGVYSYADTGVPGNPALTNPALNFAPVPGNANIRGINIEGAHVQWGDGTTSRFFLPGTPADYINIHNNGTLAFDYNGPVTLDTPISGGIYHASLATPATASVTLNPTPGNTVTFATPMNYHGTTTIGRGATLALGTGQPGGDSSLLTGSPADRIADDGTLVLRDTTAALSLSGISGAGALTQAGAATTTLTGSTPYTGATTVSAGTLALAPGAGGIAASSGLALTGNGARFDISAAGDQTVRDLTGVAGSTLTLGGHTLTVGTSASTTYSGAITGAGGALTKTGTGSLTLTGHAATPGGTWRLQQGTLALGSAATIDAGSFIQSPGTTLALTGAQPAPITVDGTVHLAGTLIVSPGPAATPGQKLTLIHTSGHDAVAGTFTGLPEGATLASRGGKYQITYTGGTGHDVVLTVLQAPTSTTSAQQALGGGTPPPHDVHAAGTASSGTPTLAVAGAAVAAAVLGLLLVVLRRRRRGQAEGHTEFAARARSRRS